MIQTTSRKRSEARGAEAKDRSAGIPTRKGDDESGWKEQHEKRQNRKVPVRGGKDSSARKVTAANLRGNNAKKRRKTAPGTVPRAAGSSPPCRTEDGSGLAASHEMRLLLGARESIREAGRASGSGRRPRVPSRKFLEASGRVMDEGAQWMTKEKREEQARKKRELKEQKRAAAAAGLQAGHVLETALLSPRGANTRPDENLRGGAVGDGDAAVSNVVWRKLTPEEILEVAGKQSAVDEAPLDFAVDNAPIADTTGVGAVGELGEVMQDERASFSAAETAWTDSMSERKHNCVTAVLGAAVQRTSTDVVLAHESRPKLSIKDHDGRQRGAEKRAARATCEFESCPKKASFGVNGVVRYW